MREAKKILGFTLIEIVIVLAIMGTLLGFTVVNFFNVQDSAKSDTKIYEIVADVKEQQIKSMVGDTEGRGIPDIYGVYIEPSQYTLFHGESYSESDPANFTVTVDSQYELQTTFPSSQIIFASKSGDILDYNPSLNSITLTNINTGAEQSFQLNKYGAVVHVN